MMRATVRLLMLAAAFALATRALGWWAVPAVAAAWTVIEGSAMRAPWTAALAAIAGWGMILLWTATTAPLGELVRRTSGLFNAPPSLLVAGTLLYGALLAWGGAGAMLLLPPRRARG